MKNPKDSKQDKKKGQKDGKHKNKDDKDQKIYQQIQYFVTKNI